jgi:cytochrome bd-type quinol oxidase subunit 2
MRWVVIFSVGLIGFLVGAYVLATPGQERSAADTFTPMSIIASLLFGGVAVFLLWKKSDNTVIVGFSVAVLTALFGFFVGPLG